MSGKKAGSDGQIRKTTAEWAVDTKTYLEGMRLMDTDTGVVRVSKGTTYADAWTPSSGPGSVTSNDVGDDSNYNTASVTAALDQAKTDIEAVDSARIAFEDTVNDQLAAIDVHIDQVETDLEQAIADEAAARTAGDATEVDNNLDPSTTRAPSKTAVNTGLALKANVADVPKAYMARLTNFPTIAAVGTPLNQLGGTPALATVGGGEYTLTITGAFTEHKTFITVTPFIAGARVSMGAERTSENVITIRARDTDGGLADPLEDAYLKVEVWP